MLYKLTCFRETLYPRGLRPYQFHFKMDWKAVSNAVVISLYQRKWKVFISFYFWLFWQSVNVAFFTWHNIGNNTVTIATIIHVLWGVVRCSNKKKYLLVTAAKQFSNQSFRSFKFIKKETLTQVFFCELCEISKNSFFYGKALVPTSDCYNALCPCIPCRNSESLSKERSGAMGDDEGDLFGKE